MAKSWIEKRDTNKESKVKINNKKFADIPAGTRMFIPTPKIVDDFVKTIPNGSFMNTKELRNKLASQYDAEMTCPLVTGIFLRIISEAAYEEYQLDKNIEEITPFWRVVDPDSKLANKLTFGTGFLIQNQANENIHF
jgi:hypothetical protein